MNLTVPKVDYEAEVNKILGFVRKMVEDAKASGVVIGLSGGVDSTLAATLCVQALGKERILGLLMPAAFTPEQDVKDAKELAEWLGIRAEFINIDQISGAFFKELRCDLKDPKQRIPMANVRARIRMILLYYCANLHNYLVVGTGDRSEALIGYFTKYGDGGADLLPIRHLYKTQIRELAKHLGIPERMAQKPSSPQLYPGHKIADEIPIGYEELDPILVGLFDQKLSPEEVSRLTGTPIKVIQEVLRRFKASQHKRTYPPWIQE